MRAAERAEPRGVRRLAKPERLRELDDAPVRAVGEDVLAQILLPRVDVAEVAAAVEQQRTVADGVAHRRGVERARRARVADRHAQTLQRGLRAKPDRVVARVVVIGEVRQRDGPSARHQRRERRVDRTPQRVEPFHHTRVPAVHARAVRGGGGVGPPAQRCGRARFVTVATVGGTRANADLAWVRTRAGRPWLAIGNVLQLTMTAYCPTVHSTGAAVVVLRRPACSKRKTIGLPVEMHLYAQGGHALSPIG